MLQPPTPPLAPHSSIAEWGAFPFVGTWAFCANVPIFWHNIAVDPPVRDDVQILGRIERVSRGADAYIDKFSVCGLELPGWRRRNSAHRVVFSNDLFDRGYFPVSQVAIEQARSGFNMIALKSSMVALTAGLSADDPINAPWCPMRGPTLGAWTPVDADLDGCPGVSAQFDENGEYTPVAANMVGTVKVPRVGLGLRMRFSYQAWPTSLDCLEGRVFHAPTPRMSNKDSTTCSWPDVRVLAAEVHNLERGSIEQAKQVHLDWINNYLTARPETERPAEIKMWRVPNWFTNKDIRKSVYDSRH